MSDLLKLFGIYDLKEEGRKWCAREFGEQYESEFVEKYETINRGMPIGGFCETSVFLEMVETIRKEQEKKTIVNRIKKLFGISEQAR